MTSSYYLEWKFLYQARLRYDQWLLLRIELPLLGKAGYDHWLLLRMQGFHIREYEISQSYYYIWKVPLISLLSFTWA